MFSGFDSQTGKILTGNIMMIVCCAFYIAWWLIAFHPDHAVKGFKSGWLLIPAFIFGVYGFSQIIAGIPIKEGNVSLFATMVPVIGGIIAYAVLFIVSLAILKRPVTTELFLIIGWSVLILLEMNSLYSLGYYSKTAAVAVIIITLIAGMISLVCYALYYNLDSVKGYIDGLIPLALAAIVMLAIDCGIFITAS